jgi:O-acetyl-ADP-ribose deacetylase (regulator of RNase III)
MIVSESEGYAGKRIATYSGGRLRVCVGDITAWKVDAIVNAANSSLLGGGGVDGAIHRAGGGSILAECRRIRATDYPAGLPTGQAVATGGGTLPATWVIHTVGPIWGRTDNPEALLADCYSNSLDLARKKGATSIAFPAISTGVYGFPKDRAARVVGETMVKKLSADRSIVVDLVFFQQSDADLFVQEVGQHVPELERD